MAEYEDKNIVRLRLGTYSLFPAIILWGTLLGGIAYSHLVYFPVYLSALPDSAVVVNGTYGLDEVIFWVIIHPLLILSLIVTLALNWKSRPRRQLILISLLIYIVVLVVSRLYFIPELMAFQRSPESSLSPAEWLTRGQRWQRLSWIRGAVCYAAFVPLLLALTKPAESGVENRTATAS
ncbi:MAG: anthrone oxygenase family protein [Pyrinomonadaceae bacterium]